MRQLQASIPAFISESLTFPRHLLTFVDTCKQQGVSVSKERQWKENSDGQMSTGSGQLLLWLQHWALKCTVGRCHSGHLRCAADRYSTVSRFTRSEGRPVVRKANQTHRPTFTHRTAVSQYRCFDRVYRGVQFISIRSPSSEARLLVNTACFSCRRHSL